MIKYATIFLFLFVSQLFSAQEDTTWKLYIQLDEISIYYKTDKCFPNQGFDEELIMLRFVNTSANTITISWKEQLWYNDNCYNCNSESEEYNHELSIPAITVIEGTCERLNNAFLTLFVQFIDKNYHSKNPQLLTKFELVNIACKK